MQDYYKFLAEHDLPRKGLLDEQYSASSNIYHASALSALKYDSALLKRIIDNATQRKNDEIIFLKVLVCVLPAFRAGNSPFEQSKMRAFVNEKVEKKLAEIAQSGILLRLTQDFSKNFMNSLYERSEDKMFFEKVVRAINARVKYFILIHFAKEWRLCNGFGDIPGNIDDSLLAVIKKMADSPKGCIMPLGQNDVRIKNILTFVYGIFQINFGWVYRGRTHSWGKKTLNKETFDESWDLHIISADIADYMEWTEDVFLMRDIGKKSEEYFERLTLAPLSETRDSQVPYFKKVGKVGSNASVQKTISLTEAMALCERIEVNYFFRCKTLLQTSDVLQKKIASRRLTFFDPDNGAATGISELGPMLEQDCILLEGERMSCTLENVHKLIRQTTSPKETFFEKIKNVFKKS